MRRPNNIGLDLHALTHKIKINMWTEIQGLAVTKTTCGLSFHLVPQEQTGLVLDCRGYHGAALTAPHLAGGVVTSMSCGFD